MPTKKRKVEHKDKKKKRTQKRLNNNIDVATSTLAIDKIYFSRQNKMYLLDAQL